MVTTGEERSTHNEFHFEGEAVCIPLVSGTGHGHASIKRLHFQKGKFCVGSILAAVMPKDYIKTSAKFLYLYLSLLKDSILVPLMQGSANVSLKLKDLDKVEVPDISIEEQLKVVDLIGRVQHRQSKLNQEFEFQQTHLQQLRQAILQEAVQGKLTLQNTNDEPADKLLQRIKAEKQQLIAAGKLKKEKELPPITKDEIPFELPKIWMWCRLGEIIYDLKYGTSQKCDYKQAKHAVLRIPNVSNGKIELDDLKFANLPDEEFLSLKLESEDILVIRSNGSENLVGRTAVFKEAEFDCAYAGYLIRLRFNTELVFSDYVHLVLESKYLRRLIESPLRTTSGVKNINSSEISNLVIPLPPLSEQHRIVAKVQKLQHMTNQLEQQVAHSQTQAKQLLQAVLKEAFGSKVKAYAENDMITMAAEE